jgi:hypothetical protein
VKALAKGRKKFARKKRRKGLPAGVGVLSGSRSRPAAKIALGAKDIMVELGVGRPLAYQILKALGRRVGRRWLVGRPVLEAWLARPSRNVD